MVVNLQGSPEHFPVLLTPWQDYLFNHLLCPFALSLGGASQVSGLRKHVWGGYIGVGAQTSAGDPPGPKDHICSLPAGLLVLVSLEVFRHSVRALMQRVSPEPPVAPALTYEYSWSLGCGVGAGLILMLGGGCFLLLALPPGPWSPLCPKWGQRAP